MSGIFNSTYRKVFDTKNKPEEESHYDTQQVCLKGHQVTVYYHEFPQFRQEHCIKCGVPTIFKCPKCDAEIRGAYLIRGVVSSPPVPVPDHCHNCGSPYPWTEIKKAGDITELIHSERLALELPPILERIGLSDGWRVASSALAAFEVLVDKKLESLKLGTRGSYDERVSRLAVALKKQGIPFDELMIASFRTARAKVLHEGKEPTENELKDIVKYLKTATFSLFPG
jgi:hypothetical protein